MRVMGRALMGTTSGAERTGREYAWWVLGGGKWIERIRVAWGRKWGAGVTLGVALRRG